MKAERAAAFIPESRFESFPTATASAAFSSSRISVAFNLMDTTRHFFFFFYFFWLVSSSCFRGIVQWMRSNVGYWVQTLHLENIPKVKKVKVKSQKSFDFLVVWTEHFPSETQTKGKKSQPPDLVQRWYSDKDSVRPFQVGSPSVISHLFWLLV